MSVDTCRDSISRFSSETEEHRQVLQDTVVLSVLEIKLLAANDTPLSSPKTTCSISGTSCWELKLKGVTLVLDKLRLLQFHSTKGHHDSLYGSNMPPLSSQVLAIFPPSATTPARH